MIRLSRVSVVGVFAAVGVMAAAGPAGAQFGGGVRPPGAPFLPSVPNVGTPFVGTVYGNPFNFSFAQRYQLTASTPFGGQVSLRREFYGPVGLWASYRYAPQYYYGGGPYNPLYTPTASAYMTGGVQNAAVDQAAKDFARAQMKASAARNVQPGARNAVYDQWAYERLGAPGLAAVAPGREMPDALAEALTAPDPAALASGEALNHVLVATVAAEPKAPKVESVYVSPLVLSKVRFAGASADAVNLVRQAGRVAYPAAFESGALAEYRPALDRDLAAVATPVLSGKAPDPAKVAALEADAAKARQALEPAVLDMGFEDAIAARRFLNRVEATAKALRAPGAAGLVDPRWAAEGVSTADLIKHMTRNKLLFGPAGPGDEDAYLALHRGLAAYLFGLTDAQKGGAKK
ncbi:MAG: hypothetical protein K2X82_24205 [Gemmataceae bacterium]|nr:hypothetical protein [Gemmataceae bacterium]